MLLPSKKESNCPKSRWLWLHEEKKPFLHLFLMVLFFSSLFVQIWREYFEMKFLSGVDSPQENRRPGRRKDGAFPRSLYFPGGWSVHRACSIFNGGHFNGSGTLETALDYSRSDGIFIFYQITVKTLRIRLTPFPEWLNMLCAWRRMYPGGCPGLQIQWGAV